MKILLSLTLMIFIPFSYVKASSFLKEEIATNCTKKSLSPEIKRLQEQEMDLPKNTDQIKKANNQTLSPSSIANDERLSFENIKKKGSFDINGKTYRIHINDNLKKRLKKENVQNEFLKMIQQTQEKGAPRDKIVGYTFSWSNNKINVSPFLGFNAK